MNTRILPLAAFFLLIGLLIVGLKIADKKTLIPSPLIDKPVPAFDLPLLFEQENRMTQDDLLGEFYLVNFWASWCVTCRVEHPVIEQLARMNVLPIVGFNFRDETEDATQWLRQFGNPYDIILQDIDGRTSIDFGVYAAPESFLVDPQGTVVYKQIGALTMDIIQTEILPRLKGKESGR